MALSQIELLPHGLGSHGLYAGFGSGFSIISKHRVNGSPVKRGKHVQIGI